MNPSPSGKPYLGIIFAAILLLVVIGYPITSWLCGKQVEAALDNQDTYLNGLLPFAQFSDRKYERGIFTSHETQTVTLASPFPAPMQFTLRSEIRHGPLPVWSGFAAAVMDSTLEVNEGFRQDAAEWIGDKKPISMRTTFNLDGSGGTTTVNSPSIDNSRLTWDGMKLSIGFTRNLASYTLQGDAPKLEIEGKDGGYLRLAGIHFDQQQKRIFDNEPLLFSGTRKLTIAQIDLGKSAQGPGTMLPSSMLVKQLALNEIVMVNDGEYVDYSAKTGAKEFKVVNQDYGPAHLNMSFRHLHARTLASIYHAYLDQVKKNAPHAPNSAELFAGLARLNQELISHGAEFSLDRLSFTSPEGEAILSAGVKFKDITAADFANRQSLLSKIQTRIDINAPVALATRLFGKRSFNFDQANQPAKTEIETLIAQGYITQDAGNIKARLEFHDGQTWLNGKAYVQPAANMVGGYVVPQPFAVQQYSPMPGSNAGAYMPPFRLGMSFDAFSADLNAHGTIADIDPHSSSSSGEKTSVWFASSGTRLFFSNSGMRSLETIRFDAPYSGKVIGIGIGDSVTKLTSMLGQPKRDPWPFGFNTAYVYNGEGNPTDRFDVGNGVVKTIFMVGK